MRSMPAYKKLDAWQLSMTFVEQCYKATASFPREELYGLTSQIRRAAVSIPANVAELLSTQDESLRAPRQHLARTHGELETCIELAHRLAFMPLKTRETLDDGLEMVGKLLSGLHRSLKEKLAREEAGARGHGAASP